MEKIVSMQQVHGANVFVVDKRNAGQEIPECDGLITNDADISLSVRVADCLPISITHKKGRVIGLIHAGWRGLYKGIIKNTVNKIVSEFGFEGKDLEVTIGPHICGKDYEVKKDVYQKFVQYPTALFKKESRTFLDLAKIAKEQLLESGVIEDNINIDEKCTYEDASLPSFRRDKTDKRLVVSLNV